MDTFSCCAYCWKNEDSWHQLPYFRCDGCQKKVHYGVCGDNCQVQFWQQIPCDGWDTNGQSWKYCIRSTQPSPLLGDTFFSFKCEACGHAGKEEFVRSSISWHNVVLLALYNLHKTTQGRCGYFHWKGHIGNFIDQHWNTLFGYQRKKTTGWMGTLAGTLSIGSPEYFLSGTHSGQQGHWRLTKVVPPMATSEKKKQKQKKKMKETPVELNPGKRKCRQVGEETSALTAAVGLKEKWSTLEVDTGELKKTKYSHPEGSSFRIDAHPAVSPDSSTGRGRDIVQESSHSNLLVTELALNSDTVHLKWESHLAAGQTSTALSQPSTARGPSFSFTSRDDGTLQYGQALHLGDLLLMAEDEYDLDLGLMVTESSGDPRPPSPDVGAMLNTDLEQSSYNMPGKSPVTLDRAGPVEMKQRDKSETESECPSEENIKDEPASGTDDGEEARSEYDSVEEGEQQENVPEMKWELDDMQEASGDKKQSCRSSKRRKHNYIHPVSPPQQLQRISLFEEGELLQKLNDVATKQPLRPELALLRRKLICNQTNREFGLPVFDLENQMEKLAKHGNLDNSHQQQLPNSQHLDLVKYLPTKDARTKETRDLDRFLMNNGNKKIESRDYTSFSQRLVGFQDHELTPVISPYTTRVLLPFIWRNFEISHKPLKLRLLQEILAFPHRNDPSWVQPPCCPLDYCYVRPEHVPAVNALCREFFWPGIDVSESLQYPDFSCVVLYRKIVIGFAFMVPDRGYNEAYISFIFTHPEWRGAGIATFMLYHLIQTCMGKDVLLHVSVTNPAMLLYQRFGFKCQELIHNFYHKYFPLHSRESTHAFLMRLSR